VGVEWVLSGCRVGVESGSVLTVHAAMGSDGPVFGRQTRLVDGSLTPCIHREWLVVSNLQGAAGRERLVVSNLQGAAGRERLVGSNLQGAAGREQSAGSGW
jgi:hypothetical protein